MSRADEKTLLQPDEQGRVQRQLVGGVTLNHLGWARLFGLEVAIFGKQADDAEGRFVRQGMASLGIEIALDLSGGASSFCHVYVDPGGGRAIYMARGATGDLTPGEIDELHGGVIDQARTVSTEISQLPLATVQRVLERANRAGAQTVLDFDVPLADAVPELGSEEELHAVLACAGVIKASRSSLEGVVSGDGAREIARALLQRYGPEAVVLTLGEEGAAALCGDEFWQVGAARVEILDTTGAGDAFLGGLLAGRHRGLDWPTALRLGAACGAACCERLGGFPDEPSVCLERASEIYAELGGSPLAVESSWERAGSGATDDLEAFLRTASRELEGAIERMDREALRAVARLVRDAEARGGRLHLTGIGKPEHVAHYAASLLASTGTPATFLHGTESTHGSVGQVREGDVVIAISNSGETRELLDAVKAARQMGAVVVALTGDANSTLARGADRVLLARVEQEGGPLGLAPRASVLAQILVLAALSVELQSSRGFSRSDYNQRHPGGSLGKLSS
jgi:arabinose-5-phosphate isomerase